MGRATTIWAGPQIKPRHQQLLALTQPLQLAALMRLQQLMALSRPLLKLLLPSHPQPPLPMLMPPSSLCTWTSSVFAYVWSSLSSPQSFQSLMLLPSYVTSLASEMHPGAWLDA